MNCPKCGSALSPQMIADVEVDQCEQCHGIWLEIGEYSAILEQENSVPEGNGYALSAAMDVITGPCPHCGGDGHMTRLTSLKRPDVVIDSCPVCYGIWLDGGELSKLAEQSLRISIRNVIRNLFAR